MADYSTDEGLEADGWAAGWDAWGVIKDVYGDAVGDDELAEAQLESLKRAILATAAEATAAPLADPYAPVAASNGHDRFEDERGVIEDLLGRIDAVTMITTHAGAVRGNHVHARTTQWTYVVSGLIRFAWTDDDGVHTADNGPGVLVTEPAGVPHAWQALADSRVLVFTRGPRSGQAYETDTTRLEERYRLL
jgi:uncharacterized RmlC-like cupin family protein